MLRNYFTIALRNFKRQKGFTLLNLAGLAIGLASVTLIYLFIIDEEGFDRFHPDSDNLYILGTHRKQNGAEGTSAYAPGAWLKAMKSRFPEVVGGTQLVSLGYPASFWDKQQDKILLSENAFWVNPDFKEVFLFPLLYGNPETAFEKPNGIVLSKSIANQFFGEQNPILIACMGLFGLSSYLAERRTKEIGIRKVLGASLPQILSLLFTPFLTLLAVACLLAIPLGWAMMHRWLQDFTYRVNLDGTIFLLSIFLVMLLTIIVVSYETVRAALVNPIKSLRVE